ncbi:hypothetical protein PYCCODRAFT_916029 [Trametes coccinea BRFM310]|uniref:F-box domain-containing protein n=1 Tax=Trametes coccinea (strain BRFM310) TaxID=1353009 RepID=A0A1Y2ICI4_TRAC3|nr:hypothetical protein PYCCODRAFT_916029 [Trametes coccinea BRFM310]
MHDCLLLPDIFQRILDFVEVEVPDRFYASHNQDHWKNGSLARLARTCRVFHEPALNALWKHQTTLAPLVRTLPEDAWIERSSRIPSPYVESDTIIDELTMIRPLTSSDWTRFEYYAHRIKSLGYFDFEYADQESDIWAHHSYAYCGSPVDRSIIHQLALHRRKHWLLPNLVRLRWTIHDDAYTEYLPLFLGPQLRTLAIGFSDTWLEPDECEPGALRSVLKTLPAICPLLTQIEIYPEQDISVVKAAVQLSSAYENLEGFHVNTMPWTRMHQDLVDDLSKKSCLRKVWLSLDEDTVATLQSLWKANAYPFSSLSTLGLNVPRLRDGTAFLKLLGHCRLFSIIVDIEQGPAAADVYDFYSSLHLHCARETLHVCRIHQDSVNPSEDEVPLDMQDRIEMAELAPALHFPHLRYFILDVPLLNCLVDEDLMRMADAWPGLIAFSLMGGWRSFSTCSVTWKGVGYMVTRCPQMYDIKITFDPSSDNVDELVRMPGFRPNRWLRFFDVLDSPLPNDAEHFARSLVAVAPRVVRVDAMDTPDDDMYESIKVDPFAFCEQVDILMCHLRKMYMSDVYDAFAFELGEDIVRDLDDERLKFMLWT